jgi:glutamate--cysteine ligase
MSTNLSKIFTAQKNEINRFFENQKLVFPFYSSVDIRDSGFKFAPVDTNLFPAGFNNLSVLFMQNAVNAAKNYLQQNFPKVKKIGILPEAHTRNLMYLENVDKLKKILECAGYEVQVLPLDSALKNFDLFILNNDLSAGLPDDLKNSSVPVIPSTQLGWYKRYKSWHFKKYQETVEEFCQVTGMDSWLLGCYFDHVHEVDFNEEKNIDAVAKTVDAIIAKTKKKYDDYKINQKPYVFVKNNRGTYGMGILVIDSGAQLLELNRREKNKMSVGKNKTLIESVLVQEGVPSRLFNNQCPAEPVMYLFGSEVVGGFFRINCDRDNIGNLNSSGMGFESFRLEPLDKAPDLIKAATPGENYTLDYEHFFAYSTVAKLAALAAAKEIEV